MSLRRLLVLISLVALAAGSGAACSKVNFNRPWSLSEFYGFCWTDEKDWSPCDYGVVCQDFKNKLERDFVQLEECLDVCTKARDSYYPDGLTNGCYQAAGDAYITCDSYCRRKFSQPASAEASASGGQPSASPAADTPK